MLIHSNTLSFIDLRECAPQGTYLAGHYHKNGLDWGDVHRYGSRSHDHALSVRLSGTSKYAMRSLPDKSATWDEWGNFIAALFKRDPEAKIGQYENCDDFILKTSREYERMSTYRPDLGVQASWL
jgi:hypothetical protein